MNAEPQYPSAPGDPRLSQEAVSDDPADIAADLEEDRRRERELEEAELGGEA